MPRPPGTVGPTPQRSHQPIGPARNQRPPGRWARFPCPGLRGGRFLPPTKCRGPARSGNPVSSRPRAAVRSFGACATFAKELRLSSTPRVEPQSSVASALVPTTCVMTITVVSTTTSTRHSCGNGRRSKLVLRRFRCELLHSRTRTRWIGRGRPLRRSRRTSACPCRSRHTRPVPPTRPPDRSRRGPDGGRCSSATVVRVGLISTQRRMG